MRVWDAVKAWVPGLSKTLGDDIPMAERKARYAAFMQAGPDPVLTAAGFKRSGKYVWWRYGDLLVVRIRCMPAFDRHCAEQGIEAWARRPRQAWLRLTGFDNPDYGPAWGPRYRAINTPEFDFYSIDPILEHVLGGTDIWRDDYFIPAPLKRSDPLCRAVEARADYYSDCGWWLSPIDQKPRWRRDHGERVDRRPRRWRERTPEQVAAAWRDVWTSIVLPFIEALAAAPEAHYLRCWGPHKVDVPVEEQLLYQLASSQIPNLRRAIHHHFAGQIAQRDHIVRYIFNTPDVTLDDLVRSREGDLTSGDRDEIEKFGIAAWRSTCRDVFASSLEMRVWNVMIASRLADHWGIAL